MWPSLLRVTAKGWPRSGCRAPLRPAATRLVLRDRARDSLRWQWRRGAATPLTAFGDPLAGTDYAWCLYGDAPPRLLLELPIPRAGTCGTRPCWSALGARGYRWTNRRDNPHGLRELVLWAGTDGHARLSLSAGGDSLTLPPLPLGNGAVVTAQLVNQSDQCWEARFGAPATTDSTDTYTDRGE